MLQPQVDLDVAGRRVDLGDPGRSRVEKVDRLGHDAERVGVAGIQLTGPLPQLFDRRSEIVTSRRDYRHAFSRLCPGTVVRSRGSAAEQMTVRCHALCHELDAIVGLNRRDAHVACRMIAVEVSGAHEHAAGLCERLGEHERSRRGPSPHFLGRLRWGPTRAPGPKGRRRRREAAPRARHPRGSRASRLETSGRRCRAGARRARRHREQRPRRAERDRGPSSPAWRRTSAR